MYLYLSLVLEIKVITKTNFVIKVIKIIMIIKIIKAIKAKAIKVIINSIVIVIVKVHLFP